MFRNRFSEDVDYRSEMRVVIKKNVFVFIKDATCGRSFLNAAM